MIGVDIHEGMLAEAKKKTTDCKKVKMVTTRLFTIKHE